MVESYTAGFWTARIGRVKQHTEDFTAAELELETRVESGEHV
jgi:hypothetical protein